MLDEDFKALETDYFSGQWFSSEKDLDVLLSQNETLPRLRMLSTYLCRNNILTGSAREAIVAHVCGDTVTVKPMVNRKINKKILTRLTQDLSQVDASRSMSMPELIRGIAGMCYEKGDGLLNIYIDPKIGGQTKTVVEFINGSRIKTPPKFRKDPNVLEGIRKKKGVPVGAYVRKLQDTTLNHRIDRDDDFEYVNFFKKITVDGVEMERRVALMVTKGEFNALDSTRAIPSTIASAPMNRYFLDNLNTILIGKRVSNAVSGFITTTNQQDTADALAQAGVSNGKMPVRGMLNPGMIGILKPGEQISMLTPRAASEGDDMFNKRVLRLSGLPHQMPYELVHQDLGDLNYSSYKGGQTQLKRSLVGWDIQAYKVVRLVALNLLLEYYMTGYTSIKPDSVDLVINIPRPTILDPEKDARGEKTELANKTASVHDLHERRGTDYASTMDERLEESLDQITQDALVLKKKKELEEQYGILFPETVEANDRKAKVREGETVDENGEPDEDAKKERRKDDGNW